MCKTGVWSEVLAAFFATCNTIMPHPSLQLYDLAMSILTVHPTRGIAPGTPPRPDPDPPRRNVPTATYTQHIHSHTHTHSHTARARTPRPRRGKTHSILRWWWLEAVRWKRTRTR